MELPLDAPLPRRSPMGRSINPVPTRLGQRRHIPAIGLHASAPMPVHQPVIGIRDHHFVPQRLQVLRHPFTFSRGLDQDAGVWATPKSVVKRSRVVGIRRSITSPPSVMIRTWLSFLCRSMAPYSMAGLLSCASERVFALWSESYHLTKEASRFIISSAPGTRCQQT